MFALTPLAKEITAVNPLMDSAGCDEEAQFYSGGTFPKLNFIFVEKPLYLASYQVTCNVAKSKKPRTVAERFINVPWKFELVLL